MLAYTLLYLFCLISSQATLAEAVAIAPKDPARTAKPNHVFGVPGGISPLNSGGGILGYRPSGFQRRHGG